MRRWGTLKKLATSDLFIALLLILFGWIAAIIWSPGHREWLDRDGTNLGDLIAGFATALVGIAGAYWAALEATTAGIEQADLRENRRARRIQEHDLLLASSSEIGRLQTEASDISFDWLRRTNHQYGEQYLTESDVQRLATIADQALAALARVHASDRAVKIAWLSIYNASHAFKWASEAYADYRRIPVNRRPPALARAKAYIHVPDDVFEALGLVDDEAAEKWAPEVAVGEIFKIHTAEKILRAQGSLSFAADLRWAAAALAEVARSRLDPDFNEGTPTDVLGLNERFPPVEEEERPATEIRDRLIESLRRKRGAWDDPTGPA